jgi:hypothetical protein
MQSISECDDYTSTLRYHVLLWRCRVTIQRRIFRYLASLKACARSVARSQNVFLRSAVSTLAFLVSFCLQAVAAIVSKFRDAQHSIFKFIRINRLALYITTLLLDITHPNTDLKINIPEPLFEVTACHRSDILISMLLLSKRRPGEAWESCNKVMFPHHHPHRNKVF